MQNSINIINNINNNVKGVFTKDFTILFDMLLNSTKNILLLDYYYIITIIIYNNLLFFLKFFKVF